MRVLLTGATGFIGKHVRERLASAGHEVVAVSRSRPSDAAEWVRLDFAQATTPASWLPHLRGIDVVINAVGILRERGPQTFGLLHTQSPAALFSACAEAGVRRVIQVSALGADGEATSAYHLSKRAADDHLLSLPIEAVVVQPSLVYGPGGTSARMFGGWASLPVLPMPGAGDQAVQPVHIDDLAMAIATLVLMERPPRRMALVGPQPLTMRDFIVRLRRAFGLSPAPVVPIPLGFVRAAASVAGRLPGSLLDASTLAMLERGNTAPAHGTAALLGGPPRPVEAFVRRGDDAALTAARLVWTLALLRWSIATVWIVTGVLSMGVFPVGESLGLLARVGLNGPAAMAALYGAALLDVGLGIATLWPRRHRHLWGAQAAVILGYTALITVWLPEYWRHPYGPLLKNVPMLAAIVLLGAMEHRGRWTT